MKFLENLCDFLLGGIVVMFKLLIILAVSLALIFGNDSMFLWVGGLCLAYEGWKFWRRPNAWIKMTHFPEYLGVLFTGAPMLIRILLLLLALLILPLISPTFAVSLGIFAVFYVGWKFWRKSRA